MNDRKSVLIVGVGSIGERHLRCFGATGRADVSFCEVNGPLREKVAERYGITRHFGRIEEGLQSNPDVVVICAPAHLHIPLGTLAVRAGAHLLTEKPLSTTHQGIAELRSLCAAKQRVVGVAYVYRVHPALAAMRAAILSGRFGKPLEVVATFGQDFPFYRPAYRDTYFRDRATGGGAVQDAFTHIINASEWILGPVDRLVADWDHLNLDGVEVEDTVHVLTRHGGVMGSFSFNMYQPCNESTLTVICQRGMARFEYHTSRWRWMTEPDVPWQDESFAPLERDALFTAQANAFLDATEGRRPLLCTLDEAEQTLRVNLAILASKDNRRWEEVPHSGDAS